MENQFLRPAQHYFGDLDVLVAGFELDLERMFPSLIQNQLHPSYSNLFNRAYATYCTDQTENNLYISIAKGSQHQLNCIGKKPPKDHHVMSDDDVVAAVGDLRFHGYQKRKLASVLHKAQTFLK